MFKGILLYITLILCLFSIMGIDDIYNKGYLFIDIIICTGLIYTCYNIINEEELKCLTLTKHLYKKKLSDEW